MFTPRPEDAFVSLIPGIQMRVVGHGEKTISVLFKLEKGHELPLHDHIYEQTGTLLKGRMRLTIGDTAYTVSPGDSWTILPHVSHQADVLENSEVFEVFSPVREDYLKHAK